MLSTPFRASMRERPCAGEWTNESRPPWSPAYRHAPRWAQTAHSSPKWLDGHHAALHAPTLPALAVVSADAVHRVPCRGLLALASLSRRVAMDIKPTEQIREVLSFDPRRVVLEIRPTAS